MRKNLLIIIAAAVFSTTAAGGLVFGQDEPTAAWQYYKGDGDQFFAEFPNIPRRSGASSPASETSATLYKAYFGKTYFFIFTCPSTKCAVYDVVNKLKFRARYLPSAKLTETRLGEASIETSFGDADGFSHRVRQFADGKINFVVHTISELRDDPAAERFLSSFTFTAPEGGGLEPDPEKFEKPLSADAPVAEPNVRRNPAAPAFETLKEPKSPFVPVSFLAKPRADHTPAARVYEITGEVVLSAKFLASKTVVDIKPVRKLPLGLTDQAVAAAATIRFDPAIRDGKPVDTVRPVTYNFTIN